MSTSLHTGKTKQEMENVCILYLPEPPPLHPSILRDRMIY